MYLPWPRTARMQPALGQRRPQAGYNAAGSFSVAGVSPLGKNQGPKKRGGLNPPTRAEVNKSFSLCIQTQVVDLLKTYFDLKQPPVLLSRFWD